METRKRKRAFANLTLLTKKLALFVLVFSFIIQPIAPAFAQEVPMADPSIAVEQLPAPEINLPAENETPVLPPVEEEPPILEEKPIKEEKPVEEQPIEATSMTVMAGAQGEGLKFQIPTQAQATVDQSTGALIYEYPISLPEGRAGMTPELSIKYNSRNASKLDSYIGLGWEASIPYIIREPNKGTNNLYSNAFFSSSLSGNLIATTDTTSSQYTLYHPETDGGGYLKYTYNSGNSWTMTGKDGKTYIFGESSSSRQDDPSDPSKVYKWMLSKITDANGNEIQYSYIKDGGQIYPSQILYTHHAQSSAVHSISFSYLNSLGTSHTIYNSAFAVSTDKLLNNIVVATADNTGTTTDRYDFSYTDTQFTGQKTLTTIQKTYSFAQGQFNQAFPGITSFTYSTKSPGWEPGTHSLAGYLTNPNDESLGQSNHIADFDRNGYPDVLTLDRIGSTLYNNLLLNNGSTFVDSWTSWLLPNINMKSHYVVVDVNGDNLPDLYPKGYSFSEPHSLYLNTGSGFTSDTSRAWETGTYVWESEGCPINSDKGGSSLSSIFFHDINADGKNDFLYFGGSADFRVYLNTGSGFTASSAYTFTPNPVDSFTLPCEGPNANPVYFQTLIDLNGDGLLDYYNRLHGTYLNTGKGFAYSSAFTINILEMDRSGFADINGDGLVDYVALSYVGNRSACVRSYINNGAGFNLVSHIDTVNCTSTNVWDPVDLQYYNENHPEVWGNLMDVTTDGFPDIVGAEGSTVYGRVRAISDARSRWEVNTAYLSWAPIISPNEGMFFDVNTDGVIDFITDKVNWEQTPMYPSKVYIGKPSVPNRLTKITSMLGAETLVEYSTAQTNYDDTDISPMSVVKKITIQNIGLSQPDMVTQYGYTGGSYATDLATGQKRFAGFHKVTATESGSNLSPLRVTETYFHQANGGDMPTSEPTDTNLSLIGRPYYSIVKHPSGTPKKEIWNKYGLHTLVTEPVIGRFSKFVYPTETVTKTTEGSVVTGTADVYTFNTTLGEQTELRNMGFVTVGAGGSYTDITGDTRYQFTEYANNTGNTIVKPKRKDIRTTPTTTTFRTDYFYDNQALGVIGALGNLTKETKWISGNGTTLANTTYTYDAFGNVLTTTNPRGAITTYVYDSTNSQIASEKNHLNQTTSYEYITGKLAKVTDPNGRITTYQYSNKGWPYRTISANTGGTQSKSQFLADQSQYEWFIQSSSYLVDNTEDLSWQVIDRLGRPTRLVRQLINHGTEIIGGNYLKEAKTYDALGREASTSAPYSTPGSADFNGLFTSPIPTNLITNTSFDVFDRPISIVNALGTTTLSYAGAETTTIDANNKQKKAKTDAYGNIIQVKEYNGASIYTTTYKYNEKNLLTKVTDALANIRNFAYNNTGWLTSSQDLRASADTTYGVTSFTYDLNGNQLVETQPTGTTVTRVYDMLDRPTSINGSTTTPVDYTLSYDTCTNGKGRVCTVTGTLPNSTTLSKSIVYGISGVPTSTTLTTLGNTYTTSYLYNYSDQVSKIIYPNGTIVRYAFGDWALPSTIFTTIGAGSETTFATISYNPAELPLVTTITNGPTITNTYDGAKLYRKTNKTAVRGATTLQNSTYTYDNVNNITKITEPGMTKTYTYDNLYRLTKAVHTPTPGTPTTYNYVYNAIGNITTGNGLAYTYSAVNKTNSHAVTAIGANAYTYDANGNMLTAPGVTFTNNWQNQPIRITLNGTTNIDAYYDENGERFIYKTPTTTEVQVDEGYIVRNNIPEIGLKLGGALVGTISNNITYSAITDHLGTPVKQVNSSGTIVEEVTYNPFGKILTQTGTLNTKRGYTGHEEDVDTGLVYAEARYYNPSIMRFTRQDPSFIFLGHHNFKDLIGVDRKQILQDPQQLNSYSYTRNNPIINKDLSGKYLESVFDAAMLSWSINDYNEKPGFWSGVAVLADAASFALPIPAIVGGIRHGDDVLKGFNKAQSILKQTKWRDAGSLVRHTLDHASDFGLKSDDFAGYAKAADSFISNADTAFKQGNKNLDSFMGKGRDLGKTYYFDYNTSTFGVKNADGTTATAFKPYKGNSKKAEVYWKKQKKNRGGIN